MICNRKQVEKKKSKKIKRRITARNFEKSKEKKVKKVAEIDVCTNHFFMLATSIFTLKSDKKILNLTRKEKVAEKFFDLQK